jgi:hypothetical protein
LGAVFDRLTRYMYIWAQGPRRTLGIEANSGTVTAYGSGAPVGARLFSGFAGLKHRSFFKLLGNPKEEVQLYAEDSRQSTLEDF